MARIQGFQRWLTATTVISPTGDYRHRVLAENALEWTAIQPHIKRYFRKAHADAVKHLRKMAGVSLHPLKKRDPAVDPTRHYPHGLDPTTLKGYFGEVLAYAIVECMGAAGYSDWDVPAYLFRFHTVAFQCLEASRLSGNPPGPIPGRTGDDSLGFRRAPNGEIVAYAYCEAKCSSAHDSTLIADAHRKVNGPGPVDILNLIAILSESGSEESRAWVRALRTFREKLTTGTVNRIDFICYVCGQHPLLKETWIPSKVPHSEYRPAGRTLDAVEIHLTDVEAKIREVYSSEGW